MSEPTAASVLAAELDAMISRAEAACIRCRGLSTTSHRGKVEPLGTGAGAPKGGAEGRQLVIGEARGPGRAPPGAEGAWGVPVTADYCALAAIARTASISSSPLAPDPRNGAGTGALGAPRRPVGCRFRFRAPECRPGATASGLGGRCQPELSIARQEVRCLALFAGRDHLHVARADDFTPHVAALGHDREPGGRGPLHPVRQLVQGRVGRAVPR